MSRHAMSRYAMPPHVVSHPNFLLYCNSIVHVPATRTSGFRTIHTPGAPPGSTSTSRVCFERERRGGGSVRKSGKERRKRGKDRERTKEGKREKTTRRDGIVSGKKKKKKKKDRYQKQLKKKNSVSHSPLQPIISHLPILCYHRLARRLPLRNAYHHDSFNSR